MKPYSNSREHLSDELHRLDILLRLHIARQRGESTRASEYRGLFISEEEIDELCRNGASATAVARATAQSTTTPLEAELEDAEQTLVRRTMHSWQSGVPLALPRLALLYSLTPFDIHALLMAIAPQLDAKYERLYGYLQNDVSKKSPTVDLILRLFSADSEERLLLRERFSPTAPLLGHRLLSFADQSTHRIASTVTTGERILNFILDIDALDPQLASFARLIEDHSEWDQILLPAMLKDNLARFFTQRLDAAPEPAGMLLFQGPDGSGKRLTAASLCTTAGIELIIIDTPRMILDASLRETAIRLFREATLREAAIYLDGADALADPQAWEQVRDPLLEHRGIVFAAIDTASHWTPNLPSRRVFPIQFPLPSYELRLEAWQRFLPNAPAHEHHTLANNFRFTIGRIHLATAQAARTAQMLGRDHVSSHDIHDACRSQTSAKLLALGRKIEPLYHWHDLILPADPTAHLKEICGHVRHRHQVMSEWNFRGKLSLGRGLCALFSGPSGTGKTMAAEVMANELRLQMFKIDVSAVVSKYIGETEKNLSRIFDEAEQSNCILFFDEADAIFGKRTEVRDSHDRYANIEVNYLLQRIEEYEGIVILASNFHKNIDEAFLRRIRFAVEFPMPDAAHRSNIWKNVFPTAIPLDPFIDFDFLAARFQITGGSIKNIALSAAFLAAADGATVRMEHIIRAVKREYQKLGRVCNRSDFDQYFELISGEVVA